MNMYYLKLPQFSVWKKNLEITMEWVSSNRNKEFTRLGL